MAKKWLSFIGSYCDPEGDGGSRITHVPDECYKKIKCPKMVFLISILRAPLILYGATIDPGMLPENIGKGHCSPSDLRSCFLACIKAINCIRFFSIWHNLAKIK